MISEFDINRDGNISKQEADAVTKIKTRTLKFGYMGFPKNNIAEEKSAELFARCWGITNLV